MYVHASLHNMYDITKQIQYQVRSCIGWPATRQMTQHIKIWRQQL